MATWYQRYPSRWILEARMLRESYPRARLVNKDGLMRVWLLVRGKKRLYLCELIYPHNFPYVGMTGNILSPEIRSKIHRFRDGSICLYEPKDVGPETTAVIYVRWFQDWIKNHENGWKGVPKH